MPDQSATVVIRGLSVPLIHYAVNWAARIEQSFLFSTRINSSGLRREQRGTTLQNFECRHQLRVTYLGDGKLESNRIYNRLAGLKNKRAVVPWLCEPLEDDTDRQGSNLFYCKNVSLGDVKVQTDQVIRIDTRNPSNFENQLATSLDYGQNKVTVEYPWQASIPVHRQVFYFCRGVTLQDLKREHATDQVHEMGVVWRSLDDGLLP